MTASEPEPFYLAEVVDNDFHHNKVTVRWYTPTTISRNRFKGQFHLMNYELELVQVSQRGRQNGQTRYKLQPRLQTLDYNQCFFGFSKLQGDIQALHLEVQRKIRNIGLFTGRVANK